MLEKPDGNRNSVPAKRRVGFNEGVAAVGMAALAATVALKDDGDVRQEPAQTLAGQRESDSKTMEEKDKTVGIALGILEKLEGRDADLELISGGRIPGSVTDFSPSDFAKIASRQVSLQNILDGKKIVEEWIVDFNVGKSALVTDLETERVGDGKFTSMGQVREALAKQKAALKDKRDKYAEYVNGEALAKMARDGEM